MAPESGVLVLQQGSNIYIGQGGVISTEIIILFNYINVCYGTFFKFFFQNLESLFVKQPRNINLDIYACALQNLHFGGRLQRKPESIRLMNIYAFSRFRVSQFELQQFIRLNFTCFREQYDLIHRQVNVVTSKWNYVHIVSTVMFFQQLYNIIACYY